MLGRTLSLRKFTLLLAAICAAVFLLSPAARAADLNSEHDLCTGANLSIQQQGAGCGKTKDSHGNFVDTGKSGTQTAENRVTKLINDVINVVSIIAGIAAVFMIIYGGFKFLTSSGNPEATKTGRNAILYALAGLLIVAFAQIIVKFVINKVLA